MDAFIGVAAIASVVAAVIPYLRSHDVADALRTELRMVGDAQRLVHETRLADAERRSGRTGT